MADAPFRLPSGTVTFVVTDIEGSTRLLSRHPEHYPAMLEEHRDTLRRTWSRFGGAEVDCQGDGSLVAFADADDAIMACARAQTDLDRTAWPDELSLRVRMGVHSGVATPVGDHYISIAVHRAARVSQAAHGGQVLVSERTAAQVGAIRLTSLGAFRVRDFDRPVTLFEVPTEEAFPPPRCLPAERHNLPARTTRLVDRAADLTRLRHAVADHRLVSVVGPGGVGKTRLVGEVAEAVAPQWADGVWLVDCSRVEDGGLLPTAVSTALGLRADDASTPTDLARSLLTWRAILVLDGCERHLEAVAHLVMTLLGTCPRLHVLATSLAPLHVPGEVEHRLPPLSTSGAEVPDAVELFLDRVAAVRPELVDDPRAVEAVHAICRRLDGLPLAVEIAAARVSALHPVEILDGLDDGIRLLRVRDPTRPARQRGLDALLEWNFGLLSDREQQALERLSLLAGSFDLETARAALAPDTTLDDAPDDVPDLVWSMVDKSLLVADPSAGGTRYRALRTVGAYGRRRLAERGGTAECARRLARHYVALAGPTRRSGLTWLHAIGYELDTIRALLATLATLADHTDEEGEDEPVVLAQTLACALAQYHAAMHSLRVGSSEVATLAARWPQASRARVGLLTAWGDLLVRSGEVRAAWALAQEAAQMRESTGPPSWDEVGVEKLQGEVALAGDRPGEAAAIAEQALTRPLGARGRARMWNMLGIALATTGDLDGARRAFRGELAAAEQERDDVLLAHAHGNAAEVALRVGDTTSAARHQRTCLEIATALGQTGMIALGLLGAARIGARAQHDPGMTLQLAAKAEHLLEETGLTLYQTDSREVEDFLLQTRDLLGQEEYHRRVRAGRDLSPEAAIGSALAVLDRVTGPAPPDTSTPSARPDPPGTTPDTGRRDVDRGIDSDIDTEV